jgi:hypothetical protein
VTDDRMVKINVKRSDVIEYAQVADALIGNDARPDWIRDDAREMFKQCSEILLHHNDPDKRIRLEPLTFYVRGFYANMVSELLERLPEVKDDQPIRVQMARQSADLADCRDYSTDFRLESLAALKVVLESLEPQTLTLVEED